MVLPRAPFSRALRGVGVTGQDVIIADRPVPNGQKAYYTAVTIENETSGSNTARLGVREPSEFLLRQQFTNFGADAPQLYTEPLIMVQPFGRLEVVWAGTTTGDVLRVYVAGYTVDIPEEKR